ncbi:hypothetical protein RHMOL_Rhmol11G0153200 [Rhododendron molle]|uniref:Uncharacterized protein n=2 Tax=Rhododendron molle TaxID=49168 RepID=A0ACC0LTL4_RHOML|nr:hypothetical protein RHMOL_Rhmol11G0153200 [Rhododendron molle]KAI8531657.1 hypothetical protein RHMOL_Rhmol11G0153200 [Rhododendron molle]
MAANLPTATTDNLFAAADLGTNSFKLLIVRGDPTTGRFLPLLHLKEPVVLGRSISSSSTLSPSSQHRALAALEKFHHLLLSHSVPPSHTRLVATFALREAPNRAEFLSTVRQTLGLEIDVVSGEEEARLIYLGVLQFHPVFNKTVLDIDIGGGSTEFVIGREGKVLYANSLKLGHVVLTEEYVRTNEIGKMREHIRRVIRESGLVEMIGGTGFEIVMGSSGTIRAIEEAIFSGYCERLVSDVGFSKGYKLDWKFRRGELGEVVGKLCGDRGGVGGKVKIEGFSKRRSEFIVAGAVLLEEIFGMLGIEEMEVSGYALGEGVIAELLAGVFGDFCLSSNLRWSSVVCLAARFNDKKRMKSAALCAGIAKEMFEGVRKWNEVGGSQNNLSCSLDDKDIEYLEAACLLHNIGVFGGKKGYHKKSCSVIMNSDLQGYDAAEVKVKHKFRILCAIIRVSALVKQYLSSNSEVVEFSRSQEGFKLILSPIGDHSVLPGDDQVLAEDIEAELTEELEQFRAIFRQKLVVVPSSTLKSLQR